jgi:hypothetical protein
MRSMRLRNRQVTRHVSWTQFVNVRSGGVAGRMQAKLDRGLGAYLAESMTVGVDTNDAAMSLRSPDLAKSVRDKKGMWWDVYLGRRSSALRDRDRVGSSFQASC